MQNHPIQKGFEKCEVNLTNTGLIQEFGCILWVSRETKIITNVSENAMTMLGIDSILGKPLSEILGYEFATRLFDLSHTKFFHELWERFHLYGHAEDTGILIEIEPISDYPHKRKIFRLYNAHSREELVEKTLSRLAEETGFERVMLYEFLSDGSGQISAEIYKGNRDSYLGLRYPATDIPKVARDLYLKNSYRYIHNVDAKPISVLSLNESTKDSLDLTHSSLRNVSPFHIEYLKNMGVACALSLSLVKDKKLTGMFSLHHFEPKYISHDQRIKLSEIVSQYLQRIQIRDSEEKMQFLDSYKREVSTFITAIHYGYYNENEITKMISLMGATGLVVRQGERWFAVGAVRISETLKAVEESITHGKSKGVFDTDCISSLYVGMETQKEQISGLMCVWYSDLITREKNSFLFVKPEVVQEVVWGSKVDIYQGGMNPINSFGQWKESMSYHSEAWSKQARNAAQTILFLSLTGHKD